jgi:hypothetical protein
MPLDRGGAYLAACTIYRDDAAYLTEWIEFHLLMGVERFFLYDEGSTGHRPSAGQESFVRQGPAVREALARRG